MEPNHENEPNSPAKCAELLHKFESKEALPVGIKLKFEGVDGRDVYNITAPFLIGGKTVIAGRVEKREVWADSQIMFFEKKDDAWVPVEGAPVFKLEDGFATVVGDEIIFGGVETFPNPVGDDLKNMGYRTVFYRGRDLSSLEKFTMGPEGMKDVRLGELANNRIGVFTRPQGGVMGPGKIGYLELENLTGLNAENLLGAKIIENQFAPEEWGGVNELHPLPDGRIGVIGHIAYRDTEGGYHYYAMAFIYDPKTHHSTPLEIIATRNNFPTGVGKLPGLLDVVFPSSLVRHGDGTATLYAGLSDTEAGSIDLPDPFFGK